MTQEEKKLLVKDLCARVPYYPILHFDDKVQHAGEYLYGFRENGGKFLINDTYYVEEVKPYLRPMSSMTEEEKEEYENTIGIHISYHYEYGDIVEDYEEYETLETFDWLNEHHFDFRGLIEKGLALEAPEDMYIY